MTAESSVELLARARTGDDRALEELLARHVPALRRWARGRLPRWARDMAETEDIVQDTVLRSLRNLNAFDYRHAGALQAYLRQAVMNRVRDECRRVARRPVQTALDEATPEDGLSPLETAIGVEAVESYETALQTLRDDTLNKLNAALKENRARTKAERAYLDNMALAQSDLRTMIQQVATDLSTITADDATNQVTAAALLIKMNVAPVVTIHLPFSGDNHTDNNFAGEASQTTASVNNIKALMTKLTTYGLQDKVTFATLNVFGRGFDGLNGRGHNASHAVSVMIGKGFKGGVVGGIVPGGHAADIDSASGNAAEGGDVGAGDSLASVAKTLGVGLGLTDAQVDDQITSGRAIHSVIAA